MHVTRTGSAIERAVPLYAGDGKTSSPPPALVREREPSLCRWVQQYRIVVITLDLRAIIRGAVASYEVRFMRRFA